MTTLKFADTHNMVAFLSKPAKSEGFEQIVDFLNANPIRYALTINPTIYILFIEQFWANVKVKTVNGEVQLQALMDGKKIIKTESTMRRDLQLEDAEGVDCLPNATIFEQLTLMGYEKISQKLTFYKAFFSPQWKFLIHTILQCLSSKNTGWNEFSSTMASAIICIATNQKFTFSKYIFESMVKNLDNASNFFMYPRFVQVFLDKQLEGMSNHNRIYVTPSHTKKIFGNIKRVGKGFSGRETPLFQIMVVQDQAEIDNVADEAVNEEMDDSLERAATTATSLDAEKDNGNINKTQSKATPNEAGFQGTIVGSSRRVESSKDEGLGEEDASKQGRIADIDVDKDITLVNDQDDADMFDVNDLDGDEVIVDNVDVVKTTTITDVEVTLAQALAELNSAKPKAVKVVIQEPEQELAFKLQAEEEERLSKEKAQQTEEANIAWDDIQAKIEVDYKLAQRLQAQDSKRAGDKLEQENAKKKKVDEDKETTLLQSLIEVVLDDEDEVAIDAIPLATKPPTIHFKTLSLDESRSPDFDLFSDQEEYSEEEVTETMAETMEQYMSKTRADYGSGVARPKIEDKDNFEIKGQFLKELRTNTFNGSNHEDANEHIEKVLKIVDLFHIPNITIDQVMLRAFPMSLIGAASRWLRNKPSGSITT
ncbi:hypothetical protein Tco_0170248 [Tanacetum coccineum]